MTNNQHEFINLYSFQKKTYPEIEKSMNISRKELQGLRDEEVNKLISDIQKIYKKFTGKRKDAFKNNFKEFYDWYEKQPQECGYCGISQEALYKLFNKDKRVLPYLDSIKTYTKSPKRSSGTLEIERKNSSLPYDCANIILACPLCNNAKSNLIDEKSWEDLYVPVMKKYYQKLLSDNKSRG
ncbi:MAG: hypothetical protein L3J43_03095 [Sulfurovum sp.]|nr:hypothetical protein [Sulfurovum sp.]